MYAAAAEEQTVPTSVEVYKDAIEETKTL